MRLDLLRYLARSRSGGEISPSFTAVATVTGLVTNSQMVAAASTDADDRDQREQADADALEIAHRLTCYDDSHGPAVHAIGELVTWRLGDLVNSPTHQLDQMLSEGLSREDDRIAEAEAAQIPADDVEIADDERRQARRDRGARAMTRETSSLVTRSIARHELREVVVRQIVERELQ